MKTKFTLEEKSGESDQTEGETRTIGIAKSVFGIVVAFVVVVLKKQFNKKYFL